MIPWVQGDGHRVFTSLPGSEGARNPLPTHVPTTSRTVLYVVPVVPLGLVAVHPPPPDSGSPSSTPRKVTRSTSPGPPVPLVTLRYLRVLVPEYVVESFKVLRSGDFNLWILFIVSVFKGENFQNISVLK